MWVLPLKINNIILSLFVFSLPICMDVAAYGYDPLTGQKISTTTYNGATASGMNTFEYDVEGRLWKVWNAGITTAPLAQYSYNENGSLIARTLPAVREEGVVVDDYHSVGGAVDVQFDGVRPEFGGSPEGDERVLGAFPGSTPVGDDLGGGHGRILRLVNARRVPASHRVSAWENRSPNPSMRPTRS